MKEPIGDLILIVILLIPVSIILCTAIKALARQAGYRRRVSAPVLSEPLERRCSARGACTFGKDCRIVALTPNSTIICENMNLIVVRQAEPEHNDAKTT